MLDRWLPRLDVLALWLLGTCVGVVVDLALASSFQLSPVLANPLRGPHSVAHLDLLGWLVLGAAAPATLALARSSARLHPLPGWTLAVAAPACGLALAGRWGRAWDGAWLGALALLAALLLPILERRRGAPGWCATWSMALALIVVFLMEDPGHRIGRGAFPRAVVWWIGVAACGAALAGPLWSAGLRLTAVASTVFWSCALWSLLANARQISKYSVGLQGVIWRAGDWWRYLGPPHDPPGVAEFLWPSLPALIGLVLALSRGPGALTAAARAVRPSLGKLRQVVRSVLVGARHELARPPTRRPAPRLEPGRPGLPRLGRGGA